MTFESKLQKKFGYATFREGQREVIENLLEGKDVIALLPTGAGKSLCYQFPAYELEGAVLVVSPLLSLMEDQVNQLRLIGEKRAVAFNSFRSFEERQWALKHLKQYKFIFASPEMIRSQEFLQGLRAIPIALLVIDEAHCISQWGHEFRPDYLNLHVFKQMIHPFATLALTATASKDVLDDINKYLRLEEPVKLIYYLDRPNLAYKVDFFPTIDEKMQELAQYVKTLQGPGIIYCGSRKWTERLTEYLKINGNHHVAYYHGGMSAEDRMLIQQQFLNNQLNLIICTSAFGMGVNKPNIRYVIHFQFPANLESYVQEIGRAGRDGKASLIVLLCTATDSELPRFMLEEELPGPRQIAIVFDLLKVHIKPVRLSEQEEHLVNELRLTELHWRFLKYHLEKAGIIEAGVLYPERIEGAFVEQLLYHIEQRKMEKGDKLQQMLHWIGSKECRRQGLLSVFDQHLKAHPAHCCDRCGLDIHPYMKGKEEQITQEQCEDWRSELKTILCLK